MAIVKGLLAACVVLTSVGFAHAGKRIALVIGNSDYAALSPIVNARHDAALIARTLTSLGFEVAQATDADRRTMARAVRDFGKALEAAGTDAIGLFYFAGHGTQAAGANYLLPVDAQIADEPDLDAVAVNAADVITWMTAVGNALNLVVLDACRNNPLQERVRSGGKGLAPIASRPNILAALAAAPGRIGTEGAAENSPYALALAEAVIEPGLSVAQVFEKVRARVESMTAGTQSPWVDSSLAGEFYLSGEPPKPAPPPEAVAAPVEPEPQPDKEVVFWNTVKDSTNVAVLQTYLDQFPNGTFAPLAQVLIDSLIAEAARQKAIEEAELELRRNEEPEALAALVLPPAADLEQPGSPSEMVALGLRYETGDGLTRDSAMAADWYREAAQLGSADAEYQLGLLYYRGDGVERDYGEAADHLLAAIKANHDPAVEALSDPTSLSDSAFLREVQERLKTLGYYRSAVDGVWGPGSRSAVIALSKGDPVPAARPATTRQRTRPSTGRAATARGRTSPPTNARPKDRANPQCSRWGKDFDNPGCAFGL